MVNSQNDRHHPAIATIAQRYSLTKSSSTKHTVHVVLNIKGLGIEFKVGDSIGIYGQNDPRLVASLIDAMKAEPQDRIIDPRSNLELSLWDFLSFKVNLSRLTSSFLKLFYSQETLHDKKNTLHRLLQEENKVLLTKYLSEHDPLDFLKEYAEITPPLQEICNQFGPLLPRFYSVASSPLFSPHHVDLTVALTTYVHHAEQRYGVGSHFLCNLAKINETHVPIYVQSAHDFALPDDDTLPIIMIGPGTGIAPFRAFLQERIARAATGKNWLFFGERNRTSDYFYEEFFEELVKQDKLILDLAFSRDQDQKVYVQHKMLEKGKELWAWIDQGANFYVCGDAHRMAKDVEAALLTIFQEHGNMSEEGAKTLLKTMRKEKRFLADVY